VQVDVCAVVMEVGVHVILTDWMLEAAFTVTVAVALNVPRAFVAVRV